MYTPAPHIRNGKVGRESEAFLILTAKIRKSRKIRVSFSYFYQGGEFNSLSIENQRIPIENEMIQINVFQLKSF